MDNRRRSNLLELLQLLVAVAGLLLALTERPGAPLWPFTHQAAPAKPQRSQDNKPRYPTKREENQFKRYDRLPPYRWDD